MKSPLRALLHPRNAGKPPIPLDNGRSPRGRGLSYNLGNGRQDAESFMRQYGISGTVFGIVSLLAESAATPTWHLYKKPPVDGRRRYTTGDQGSDQRVEVVQHAAIQLWNSPNDWHSGFEFREGAQQHEELTGETFWVLDMEAGFPTSMWYVRPDRMEPVPDPDLFLTGWIYTGPNGEQVPLRANEVILEKKPDPLDPYRGAGPVASIMPNIAQQRYATEYQRNLFLNGADPGGIITVPNRLSDTEFDELIDRWRESHRGVARAGHVGVLESGATWEPRASTNKDLEYGELRLANRDEMREAWRIHKAMMGTSDDVNRADAQTAEEVFVAWQTLPRLIRRRDTLNNKLLPLFAGGNKTVEFDYEDPSPVNAETAANELLTKSQAAAALVTAGYEPHDVLETVGLPDMDVVETATQQPALPPGWVTPMGPGGAPEEGGSGASSPGGAFGEPRPGQTEKTADTPPGQGGAAGNWTRPFINIRSAAAKQPPAQLQSIDAQWKAAVANLVAAWRAQILAGWFASLLAQIRQYLAEDNVYGLAVLKLDPAEAIAVTVDHADAYAHTAAKQAAVEAVAQGVGPLTPHTPTSEQLADTANVAVTLLAQQIALQAGRQAAHIATGAQPDADDVAGQVKEFLEGLSDAMFTYTAGGILSSAQNRARLATITAGPRCQLVATEMHDANTCKPCDRVDGKVFGFSDDPAAVAKADAAYPNGGYVGCEGGARCRGTLYADYTAARTAQSSALAAPPVHAAATPPPGTDEMTALLQRVLSDGYVPIQLAGRR